MRHSALQASLLSVFAASRETNFLFISRKGAKALRREEGFSA